MFGQPIFPGEIYQAGIGQGYDAVTPMQLLNAYAALANGGKLYQPQVVARGRRPRRQSCAPFEPEVHPRSSTSPASVLETMREAARHVVMIRHTYNLVDLPIVVAGKSGTAEFGTRDSKGACRSTPGSSGFVPKDPRKKAGDPNGYKAVSGPTRSWPSSPSPTTRGTKGNVATEIVKYFLQLHYGIKKDYRNFDLLKRGNFYRGATDGRRSRASSAPGQRVHRDWSARVASAAVWRAFDLQLAIYRAPAGHRPRDGLHQQPRPAVGVFDGGTVPARPDVDRVAIVVFLVATAFDYRWLQTFAWPIYLVKLGLLVLTLAIGGGVGGRRAGSRSSASSSSSASSPRS